MLAFQFNYLLVTLFISRKINRMCGSASDWASAFPRLASHSELSYLEINKV
jgi:hypothetical protein